MARKWGTRWGGWLTTVLFMGAGVSLATRILVSVGRHDGPIGLAGLMLCIVACTRYLTQRFDRSITATFRLGQQAERRRAAREEQHEFGRRGIELVRRY